MEQKKEIAAEPKKLSIYEEFAIVEAQLKELAGFKAKLVEEIIEDCKIDVDFNGAHTLEKEKYKITFSQKLNRTIDAEKLKDVARENNASDSLNTIFAWKPTVVAKEWEKVNPTFKAIFAQAFTEKYGKVSIKIKEVK
jgi:hypothetical protein